MTDTILSGCRLVAHDILLKKSLSLCIMPRYTCLWKWCSMELDISPYTKLGFTFLIMRMIALYISFWLVSMQCMLMSVDYTFKMISFFDAYLVMDWYLRINNLLYINGVMVTDRRLLFKNWLSSRIVWDILTLFPFEVKCSNQCMR